MSNFTYTYLPDGSQIDRTVFVKRAIIAWDRIMLKDAGIACPPDVLAACRALANAGFLLTMASMKTFNGGMWSMGPTYIPVNCPRSDASDVEAALTAADSGDAGPALALAGQFIDRVLPSAQTTGQLASRLSAWWHESVDRARVRLADPSLWLTEAA